MRVGLVVPVGQTGWWPEGPGPICRAADELGLDIVLLCAEPCFSATADALVAAAFLAPRTEAIRLAALTPVGSHPVLIAEQAAVADNASGGRFQLVLDGGSGPSSLLSETVEVVLAASGPRAFRHAGEHWQIPADPAPETVVAVTPKPAQLELPVWLAGTHAASVARRYGLSHMVDIDDRSNEAATEWGEAERRLGDVTRRLRRPGTVLLGCRDEGTFDADLTADELRAESASWGLDVVLLRLPHNLGPESAAARGSTHCHPVASPAPNGRGPALPA